jgi:aldose 1-epimerase
VIPGTSVFGTTAKGRQVHRAVISNGTLSAAILTHGAALQDARLGGISHSLTVGSPDLAAYEGRMASCGSIVGPVGNRIGNATATIDGVTHHFDKNLNGKHTLHGGGAATHRRIWDLTDTGPTHATFQITLEHGEHGFPGNRTLTARYDLPSDATLRLILTAATDAPTLMNLANHSYWRLDDAPTFAGQTLKIAADRYLPATIEDVLPTGDIAAVDNTRFDYRQGRTLQAGAEGLIDTNFCLSQARQPLRPVAWLTGTGGLRLEMSTTEPGLQVFDGHILNLPQYAGNDGAPYAAYAGLALEAQFWPDAPNNPRFPPILLRPGDDWQQVTTWRFGH